MVLRLFVLTLTHQEHAQRTQDFKLHKRRLGREQGKNNIQTAAFNKFCLVSRYRNKKNTLLFDEIINCVQKNTKDAGKYHMLTNIRAN